jgi:NADH dehydrogenase (ubiquinone) 1 beta subcomplex subunit 7
MSWNWDQVRDRAEKFVAENGDGEGRAPPVSQEELRKNHIPRDYRDHCAHLLIPLNVCRTRSLYAPWKCTDERHAYEECQFGEYVPDVPFSSKRFCLPPTHPHA